MLGHGLRRKLSWIKTYALSQDDEYIENVLKREALVEQYFYYRNFFVGLEFSVLRR